MILKNNALKNDNEKSLQQSSWIKFAEHIDLSKRMKGYISPEKFNTDKVCKCQEPIKQSGISIKKPAVFKLRALVLKPSVQIFAMEGNTLMVLRQALMIGVGVLWPGDRTDLYSLYLLNHNLLLKMNLCILVGYIHYIHPCCKIRRHPD